MFGNKAAHDTEPDADENPTEFVMKKEGHAVHVWAVVDGEEVFHAAPHIRLGGPAIKAGVQTFLSRAFEKEIPELTGDDDDKRGFL